MDFDRIGMDRNLAARLLDFVPLVYGQNGKAVVDLYRYFSWVDDIVDENKSLTKEQKIAFIDRQIDIMNGNYPDDSSQMENRLLTLEWNLIPEEKIKEQACILLNTIKDDAEHMFLLPRTETELRNYHLKTILSIVQIASLALNGRIFEHDQDFLDLIVNWERKDHVNHFEEDTSFGIIKLPLTLEELEELRNMTEQENRQAWLKDKFTLTKLAELQKENLHRLKQHLPSINKTNFSFSQKILFTTYLLFRIQTNTLKNWKRKQN